MEPALPVEPTPSSAPPRSGIKAIAGAFVLTFFVLVAMGRPFFGPPGFGIWVWDIWSPANSQYLVDPYSFSHLVHGFLFFALLRWLAPRMPLERRLLIAVLLEASWEILENSPLDR